jgi:hypothetical protein
VIFKKNIKDSSDLKAKKSIKWKRIFTRMVNSVFANREGQTRQPIYTAEDEIHW